MMFFITDEAKKYILKTGKDIVITFTFEPSGGGCSCVADCRVAESFRKQESKTSKY